MDVRVARPGVQLLAPLALLALAVPASAEGQQGTPATAAGSTSGAVAIRPAILPPTPPGFEVGAREAARIAARDASATGEARERGRLRTVVEASGRVWQVGFLAAEEEVAQVHVDGDDGEVRESWTGTQVAWRMARGYEGQFGHALNAPYVWIPLSLIFFAALCEWRRPWRVVHLDLLVLLSFGLSHVFFNRGEIGLSVPLAYPPLLYLLARMLWVGFRGGGEGVRPSARTSWLAIAAIVLIAFRITLNVVDSGPIDVGYAGVVGADRITDGEPIYGEGAFPEDNPTGDTYGPANYLAYVPFETVLPWSGEWDALPAAHAAAIFFDLATVAGLFALGALLRPGDRRGATATGVVLAFAWLSYPYTAFALQSNSNDSLVSALAVWGLVALRSPPARGALVGLAATAKLAPLALAPLYLAGQRGIAARIGRSRHSGLGGVAVAGVGFAGVVALMLAHPAIDPGLATFWERTGASQLDRESPFSVWGQAPRIAWAQPLVIAAAGVLAAAAALWPRERSPGQVAALGASVLLALQLGVDHWFYLYIPWFAALVMVALLGTGATRRVVSSAGAGVGSPVPIRTERKSP